MTAPHPVPATIDGLLATCKGAPELAYEDEGELVDLYVVDGLPIPDLDVKRALFVGTGAQYAPGGASATSAHNLAGADVHLDVTCELQVWSGDEDPAAVRDAAFGVLDAVTALLAQNSNLGGLVDWARVVRSTYAPSNDRDGAEAIVEFTVRVDAHRDHEG